MSLVGPNGVQLLYFFVLAFQSRFALEYSSCFISVMNRDLYVGCFDSLMSRAPSHKPNNFYMYMNHSRTQVRLLQRKTGLISPVIYY